jgi:hypothetical protein
VTILATLILTVIDVATEVQRRKTEDMVIKRGPSQRIKSVEAHLNDLREELESAIRDGRDVTAEEMDFWNDRIKADCDELRQRAARHASQDQKDP